MKLFEWCDSHSDPDAAPTAPIQYWLTTSGTFRVQSTVVGRFVFPWPTPPPIPEGLTPAEPLTPGVTLAVPKIPEMLVERTTAILRALSPQEHLYNIYWYPRMGAWEVENPPQQTTASSVTLSNPRDPFSIHAPRVLQFHSHGRFPAVFSATDDADEVAAGLYGVVSFADPDQPVWVLRAAMAGQFLPITWEEVMTA